MGPGQAPAVGPVAALPPIPAAVLEANALRRRFGAPPRWTPEIGPELRASVRPTMPAAVLIGIVQRPSPSVLFTRRSDRLRHHPGQICFPGGRIEPHDGSAAAAALREAHEEIGLDAANVEPLGVLPAYATTSGFAVSSLVALVSPDARFTVDAGEVADVFEVPFDYLMSPANHGRHTMTIAGSERVVDSIPWRRHGADDDGGVVDCTVWGATAAMLRNLYRFLAA